MIRFVGLLCAGLLIAVAGCTFDLANTRVDVAVKLDDQAVEATLENAAEKIRTALERRGLQVAVSQDTNVVRLASTTKAGDKFTVVLTHGPSKGEKERTRVRIEWETVPDRELWLGLLVSIGASALEAPR